MWCNPCRAVGMIHCAHPDECGNMLSHKAAADSWKAWLDDLPLDACFDEGIGRVQDFISGTVARAEAAEAEAAALREKVARLEGADDRVRAASAIEHARASQFAAEAKVARLEGALHNCVGMLDCLVAESGRSIEWGQEDPFRMGEWFEPDDIKQLAQARAALSITEASHE